MFLMLFYTYLCFRINSMGNSNKAKGHIIAQKIFIMLIFSVCYGLIMYYAYDIITLIVFILEFLFLLVFPLFYNVIFPDTSRVITNNMTFLLALGYIMVMRLKPSNTIKQFSIVLVGSVLMFFIPIFIKKKNLIFKSRFIYAIVGIVLLAITLVLGKTSFGANISFTIAGFTFQPSEFVKILFVLFEAAILSKSTGAKDIALSAILAGVHILILVASTDLGAALIFFVVYLIILYVSTGKISFLITGFTSGCGAAFFAYKVFSHVRVRVSAWLDPWADIDNKGYQITQSLFAIGTGGLFGMGLYEGLPTSIPVVDKDFVFAAISEELGLVFALCVVFVCISIFLEIMKIASACTDMFYKLIAVGFGVLYIFQCFLTIGGVVKFIPSTGVTLPFVSYGGSSILSSLIMFAIIQTICIKTKGDVHEKE